MLFLQQRENSSYDPVPAAHVLHLILQDIIENSLAGINPLYQRLFVFLSQLKYLESPPRNEGRTGKGC